MAVQAKAGVNLTKPVFKGDHQELLEEFYSVFRKLWDEHYTSPVFAGDEMIFALGGNGYVVVVSNLGFEALVEIRTPRGGIDLRPNAELGGVAIAKVDSPDGIPADGLMRSFIDGIQDYYAGGPRLRV